MLPFVIESQVEGNPATKKFAGTEGLLASFNEMKEIQISKVFDELKLAIPNRTKEFDQLQTWVNFYRKMLPAFPLQLMHRRSMADLIGSQADNPGPGGARKTYRGSSSKRVPLEVMFEKPVVKPVVKKKK